MQVTEKAGSTLPASRVHRRAGQMFRLIFFEVVLANSVVRSVKDRIYLYGAN